MSDDVFDWSVIGGSKPMGNDQRNSSNLFDENQGNEWVAEQKLVNGAKGEKIKL